MINVYAPDWALAKIKFILEDLVVPNYRIGFRYFSHGGDYISFTVDGYHEFKIKLLNRKYYETGDRSFLQKEITLRYSEKTKVLYAEKIGASVDLQVNNTAINQDIFFAVIFIYSQCHERTEKKRDEHGRIKSSENLLVQMGVHEIPVIDYTVNRFIDILSSLFSVKVEKPNFQIRLSHDVDRPARYALNSNRKIMRSSIRDVTRGIFLPVINVLLNKSSVTLEKYDPYFTFNWILANNKKFNTKSTFNFFSRKNNSNKDAHYCIKHPALSSVVKQILDNNDKCGLHLSYFASHDEQLAKVEVDAFLSSFTLDPDNLSSRNHYLRWDPEVTPKLLEQVGIKIDTTYGFYDAIGFRAGTSRRFRFYDLLNSKPFDFYEQPLIFMECALFSPKYSNVSKDTAYSKVLEVIDRIYDVGGNFEVLWHNSELYTGEQRALYVNILKHSYRYTQ